MSYSSQSYIVTADIGTTSFKALVVNRDGQVAGEHAVHYPLHTPLPDRAEQSPQQILAAVLEGISGALRKAGVGAEDVLCVSFSSAMHGLIAVDEQAEPLTPLITWADNRSQSYVDIVKQQHGGLAIYRSTGTPIHPMSPLLKLMWLRDNEPDIFERAHKFIGIKEYIFAKLFGEYVVDYSLASTSGLFELATLQWHGPSLAAAGITAERLSTPVPGTYRAQGLKAADAAALGLRADTPFVVGAADGVLANLGSGSIEPGVYAVTIGTSGAVRGMLSKPLTDPQGRLFCYALAGDDWVVGGAINNGGIVLRWVRDVLATLEAEEARRAGEDPYDHLLRIAEQIAPGAGGLLFLPLLAGERAPHYNAEARGVFFGLSLAHGKPHMIRAALEGVLFRIQTVLDALVELGGPVREIRASGGFARSPLWRQMLADVCGAPVVVAETVESSGIGAAWLGLMAMGEADDAQGIRSWVRTGVRHEPNAANHAVYAELLPIYRRVYQQLTAEFAALADFQQRHAGVGRQ